MPTRCTWIRYWCGDQHFGERRTDNPHRRIPMAPLGFASTLVDFKLVSSTTNRVYRTSLSWPRVLVGLDGQPLRRPDVLEVYGIFDIALSTTLAGLRAGCVHGEGSLHRVSNLWRVGQPVVAVR